MSTLSKVRRDEGDGYVLHLGCPVQLGADEIGQSLGEQLGDGLIAENRLDDVFERDHAEEAGVQVSEVIGGIEVAGGDLAQCAAHGAELARKPRDLQVGRGDATGLIAAKADR